MSEPFLAEIRIVGFNFPPRGWAFCDGQILPINQNQSLYSLLGTTYGGDGRTSFGLPDLRGRTPIHDGSNGESAYSLGQKTGEETHAVSVQEMPQHEHELFGTSDAQTTTSPANALYATSSGGRRPVVPYGPGNNLVALNASHIMNSGSNSGHENMQPFLALNFCIALQGLFPSRG